MKGKAGSKPEGGINGAPRAALASRKVGSMSSTCPNRVLRSSADLTVCEHTHEE